MGPARRTGSGAPGGGGGRDLLEGEGPLGGKLRAVTKRLGRTVKLVGERSLAVGKAVGGGIGVGGMPLGRVVG